MGFYRGPRVITNGLVLALDAGSERSYSQLPQKMDVLIVGGGGAGGTDLDYAGGGGGAVVYFTGLQMTPTPYTITIGAGGTPNASNGAGGQGGSTLAFGETAGGGQGGGQIASSTAGNSGTITGTTSSRVLLDVSPGRIEEEGRTQYEYNLPSVRLVRTTDAEIVKKENPFIIKNSWFEKKPKQIEFEIADKDNINNLLLSFNTLKNEGTLAVKLNTQVIYEKDINQYNSDPIILPKEKLTNGINRLEFSTSSVGVAFWNANEYAFENVKILADITDVSGQDTKTVFNILDSRDNINEARLIFVPECESTNTGRLRIRINADEIFSAVPDCNVLNTVLVPPTYIETGINEVGFKTEKGTYLVDRIKVKTDLKEKREPKFCL